MTFFFGLTFCSWRRSSRPQGFHAQNTHSQFDVAEQPVTNFNGDGGEHSQTEKRRAEAQKWQRHTKKLVSCHINASIAEVRMHIHTDARTRQMYVYRQLTVYDGPKSYPKSPVHAQQES